MREQLAPRGSALMMFGLTGLLMTGMRNFDDWELALAIVAAGALTDVAIALFRPIPERPWARHLVALFAPLVVIGLYLVAVWWRIYIKWPIELWSGTVVLGMLGGVVSLLMTPRAHAPGPDSRARVGASRPIMIDGNGGGNRPAGAPTATTYGNLRPVVLDEESAPVVRPGH